MVASKINPVINYPESKTIDPEDIGHSSFVYEFDVSNGNTISVVLGKPKYTFTEKNVIYLPIYAISDDTVRSQIGVFEISPTKIVNLFKNGELDVSRLSFPVLYSFATEKYVAKLGADPSVYKTRVITSALPKVTIPNQPVVEVDVAPEKEEDRLFKVTAPVSKISAEKRDVEQTLEKGIFIIDKDRPNANTLVEETEPIADELRKDYRESAKNTWIEKHMKNNYYRIREVPGDGDCYFTCIRTAFEQIGRKTTVDKMRAILANEVTDELFQDLRNFYLHYEKIIKGIQSKMNGIQRSLKTLKKDAEKMVDKRPELIAKAKQYAEEFEQLRKERTAVERQRNEEIGYMKDIDTLDKYRAYVRTQSYWADEWAISTLERILNFKTIILSKESFDEGSVDNVMKCGEANAELVKRGTFTPEFYVMVSHTGNHYDLITYRDKYIFQFTEIPFDIKMLILNKCLEKNAGPYYLIQDFRNFKTRFGLDADEGRPIDYSDAEGNGDLYDDTIQFIIHPRASTEKVGPGKAEGEKIPRNHPYPFTQLIQTPEWRKKLDDQWTNLNIRIRGKTWSSVFHYTEGSKFRIGHPDIYEQFAIESNNPTSTNIADAKSHKKLMISGTTKRKTVKPDVDYVLGRDVEERDMALRHKFKDNMDMRELLLSTQNALLLRKPQYGEPAEPDMLLMRIRKELQMEEMR
jgi:predicted NAD-dependent protein-ADP-ribosyltransferase YbiA (DUF1768 family)